MRPLTAALAFTLIGWWALDARDPAAPASAYMADPSRVEVPVQTRSVWVPAGDVKVFEPTDVTAAPPVLSPEITRFEDGSWRNDRTGESGCDEGALCDE